MIRIVQTYITATATASFIALAVPAAAAEGASCVFDQISEAQKAEFFTAYRANQPPPERLRAHLETMLRNCAATHGWNGAQQETARQHTIARLLYDRLTLASPFSADELARLGTALDAVEPETIQHWIENGVSGADGERLSAVIASVGVRVDERNDVFLGEYMAARHLLRTTAAALAGS